MNRVLNLLTLTLPCLLACSDTKSNVASVLGIAAASDAATADLPEGGALSLAADAGARRTEIQESEFAESDRNRDPFRAYSSIFVETVRRATANERQVILGQYGIEELKLVAIVSGGDAPRAMLLDPNKTGYVVKRGDFVGRPEIVHTGGTNGSDYQLNWRVDRVRDGDIVLIREDPAQPGIVPATRVIALRPEGEEGSSRRH